jgi:hypothetical protein
MKKLSLLLLLVSLISQAQIQFTSHVLTDENSGFSSIDSFELIDMDNDGDRDIFAYRSGSMVVYERFSNGQFSKPQKIETPYQITFKPKVGDLNGDNLPDLVMVTSTSIAWMPHTGSFTNYSTLFSISSTNVPNSVKLVDRDADGDLDIFFYDTFNSGWFINNNNAASFTYSPYFGSGTNEILVQDVNGDNAADFISKASDGEYNLRLTYYNASATNSYQFMETLDGFAVGGYPAVGDLDGDGDQDIAYAYLNGNARQLIWYRNNGASGFAGKVVIANLTTNPSGIYIGNLNSNGAADIVLTYTEPNRISWVQSEGNGNFSSEQTITTDANLVRNVVIADADGDGFNDLLFTSYYDSKMSYMKSSGTLPPTFTEVRLNNATFGAYSVAAGDLDQDGDKDIVQASLIEQKISWFKNENGAFSNDQITISEYETYAPYRIRMTDIDNDADQDLLYYSIWEENTNDFSALYLLKNSNNGATFTKTTLLSLNNEILTYELLDVDNDGDKDIVVASQHFELRLMKNNGNGTFSTPVLFSTYSFNNAPSSLTPGDFDNDGDLDLATQRNDGELSWFENENGTFTTKNVILPIGSIRIAVNAFDYDSDGDQDLLYTQYQAGRIGVLKNQGTGVFDAPLVISDDINRPIPMRFVDLELDGDIDLVCGSEESKIFGFINNGQHVFDSFVILSTELSTVRDLAIADFTGDGLMDVAAVSYNDDGVIWIENNGLTSNSLSGTVKFDLDENGCNASDTIVARQLVEVAEGNFEIGMFTNDNGQYEMELANGDYNVSMPGIADAFVINPALGNVQLNDSQPTANQDFCLSEGIVTDDLELSIYPLNNTRAGFAHALKLVIRNVGAIEKNATVNFYHNASKMIFGSALPTPDLTDNGMLQFSFAGIKPFEQRVVLINLTIAAIPIVSLDEVLNVGAEILNNTGDVTIENNSVSLNQTVIASYDPNDVTCLEGENVAIENADNYLHYRIRFENTGNTFADRVVIKTTLDNQLDWSTLQPENASHPYVASVKNGNEITFTFNAIYLPAASQNPAGAQGYVLYKIKPKNTVVLGDEVAAQASIFFDFNPPIITNTALTRFVDMALTTSVFDESQFVLFPNPAADILHSKILHNWESIKITDALGKVILTTDAFPIDISRLQPGLYLVNAKTENGTNIIRKIMKR